MKTLAILALAAALMAPGVAGAAEYQIQMLNKGPDGTAMVFSPNYLHVQPGDTVEFVPTDKGHDAETIKGMIPDGAKPFKSKFSKPYSVTLNDEGVYGIRCTPHFAMGMVALIVVGDPVNEDAAKAVKVPSRPGKVFAQLFDELDAGK